MTDVAKFSQKTDLKVCSILSVSLGSFQIIEFATDIRWNCKCSSDIVKVWDFRSVEQVVLIHNIEHVPG